MLHWCWFCQYLYSQLFCNGSWYSQIAFRLACILCWMPHHLGFQVTHIGSSKYHQGGVHCSWKRLPKLGFPSCVPPLTFTERHLKTTQVLWKLHVFRNYDHVPSTAMYVTITFMNTYTTGKLKSIQLQLNFKLPTLPPRHYHKIFLFDTKKRFLVTNPKSMFSGSVTILCNCTLS